MSLIHWWSLNGNLKDIGVLNNSLINSNASISNSGKIGQCYSFTYTSHSYLYWNDSTFMDTYINHHSFSLAYWTKIGSTNSRLCAFGLSYGLRLYGNVPVFSLYNADRNVYAAATTNIADNKWHHVCGTYDASTNLIKIYIDGVLEDTSTYPTGTYASSWNNGLFIGYDPNNNTDDCWYDGLLNDIRIYDHALSAKEVKEISKGLVLHYNFEDAYIEGTTNLITQAITDGGWYWSGSATVTNETVDVDNPALPFKQCRKTTYNISESVGGTYDSLQYHVPVQGSTLYAYSLYVKTNLPFSPNILYRYEYDSNNDYITEQGIASESNREYLGNGWYRYFGTFTTQSNTANITFQTFNYPSQTGELYRYVGGAQLEQKEHVTPYILGTRPNGKVYDNSGYGYNGTQNGGLEISSNSASGNHSMKFSDFGQYIQTNLFTYGWNVMTYSAWVYPTARTSDRSCISIGGTYFTIDENGHLSGYAYGKSSEGYHTGTAVIPLNQWTHIAIVWDESYIYGYVNGQLDFKVVCTGSFTISTPQQIGQESGSWRQFYGCIADFKIYATALSASDIMAEYKTKASIDKTGKLFAQYLVENGQDEELLPGTQYGPDALFIRYDQGGTVINNSNGDLQITGSQWVASDMLPVVQGDTYYYEIIYSNTENNLFYVGLEQYDEDGNSGENELCWYCYVGGDASARDHRRVFGSFTMSGTSSAGKPLTQMRLRILNNWNWASGNMIATIHHISLRHVTSIQPQKVEKNGVVSTNVFREDTYHGKTSFYKNGVVSSTDIIEC